MAPRSRARSIQAAPSTTGPVGIADLPDEVLQRCLGFLELRERQRAALVGRQFAAVACSPELLRKVKLPGWRSLQALHSQAAWLARHRQHVRALTFSDGMEDEDEDEDESGVASAVASCLTLVGAAGQLEELDVQVLGACHTDWLLAMRSLRRLRLDGSPLQVSPAIFAVTALQSLKLDGQLQFAAGAALPASITRIRLRNDDTNMMPQQVTQLPQLERLMIDQCAYSADSLASLSALAGSLTRLHLYDVQALTAGASLAALSRLQHLQYRILLHDHTTSQAVASALPHLTGLTYLELWGTCGWDALLPALSGLWRLRLCQLSNYTSGFGEDASVSLRDGPWLRSLEWLSADLGTLLSSTPVLRAATQLHTVSVGYSLLTEDAADCGSPAAAAFFDWLASHPPLRRLSMEHEGLGQALLNSTQFLVHMLQLWRRRPALQVQAPGFGDDNKLESFSTHIYRCNPF